MEISYGELYHMDPVKARGEVIKRYWETNSISQKTRDFFTSRKVVRSILRRFKERGEEGLKNKKPVPKNSPKRVAKEI